MNDISKEQPVGSFEEIVETHESDLLRYAVSLLGDFDLARDAVQDAFLKLCRESRKPDPAKIRPWLFTVCRNRAFDIRRKEKRMIPFDSETMDTVPDREAAPWQAMEDRERENRVTEALSRLTVRQQEIVRLKFQHGMSYQEISQVTQLSVSNVGFILHAAIKALRTEMIPGEEKNL